MRVDVYGAIRLLWKPAGTPIKTGGTSAGPLTPAANCSMSWIGCVPVIAGWRYPAMANETCQMTDGKSTVPVVPFIYQRSPILQQPDPLGEAAYVLGRRTATAANDVCAGSD